MIEDTEFYRILKSEIEDSSSEKTSSIRKETRNSAFKSKTGTIYFNKIKKLSPTRSLRIKKFRIKISSRRMSLELGCHPTGVHWREQAIFYSKQGCIDCKLEMELYRKLL